MNCAEIKPLLDAYFDSELDLQSSLSVERHTADCADCSMHLRNLQQLRDELTPEAFQLATPEEIARLASKLKTRRIPSWSWALAAAAVIAVAILVPRHSDNFQQELIDDHVRSLAQNHLVDVPSSDQHTVKPWFQGKIDFSPEVPDLGPQGFDLIGGRLDVMNGRPTAAIIYKRKEHVINVWIQRTSDRDSGPQFSTDRGFQVAHWTKSALSRWAVSDLNPQEFQQFVNLLNPNPN